MTVRRARTVKPSREERRLELAFRRGVVEGMKIAGAVVELAIRRTPLGTGAQIDSAWAASRSAVLRSERIDAEYWL